MAGDKLYRTSLEGMDTHLYDDASEEILPEGIPDERAAARYRSYARKMMLSPVSKPSSSEHIDNKKNGAQQPRTLWEILNTPIQNFFGGSHDK